MTRATGTNFFLRLVPFFLGVLLFHTLVGLSPDVLEVFGLRNARLFRASPLKPLWLFHNISSLSCRKAAYATGRYCMANV